MMPLNCWDRWYESRWGRGFVSSGLCDGLYFVCVYVCNCELSRNLKTGQPIVALTVVPQKKWFWFYYTRKRILIVLFIYSTETDGLLPSGVEAKNLRMISCLSFISSLPAAYLGTENNFAAHKGLSRKIYCCFPNSNNVLRLLLVSFVESIKVSPSYAW